MIEQEENCENNLPDQVLSLSVPLADDTNSTTTDELPTELVEVIRMNNCNSNSKEQPKVDALNKSKVQRSDLELGINRSKTEEAGLNDGLHQDDKIFPMADKDALESALYKSQEQARQFEVCKEQLEGENQELIIRKENLQSEINRLCKEKDADNEKFDFQREDLNRRLAQLERDMQMAITQEKQAHEDDVDRLSRERDNQRGEFESQREEMITQYNMEKEESNNKFDRMREELMEELAALQRDWDNSLMMAENGKQQTMSILEQQKSTLAEKNNNLTMNLANANVENERLKREYYAKQEQDRTTINGLCSDLKNLRSQFDETCMNHEKECKDLTNNIRELERQREGALREVAELKTQLKLVEENHDNIRGDLIEANRRIREGEKTRVLMRKDIVELKRNINYEVREKDTISKAADELRKRNEADKTELNRALHVLGVQKANVQKEARCELQELRRQMKQLDGERNMLGKEVGDLQNRVARDVEKEEQSKRTLIDLKQKVTDTEASRSALIEENIKKDYALEDSLRIRMQIEDHNCTLKNHLENTKRKLDIIVSIVRNTIAYRQNMTTARSPVSFRSLGQMRSGFEYVYVTTAESRSISTDINGSPHRMEVDDVDPEDVRLALNELVQQLAFAETEKDYALANTESTGCLLQKLNDERDRADKAEETVYYLQTNIARLENVKRDDDNKISSIVTSLRRTFGFRQGMPRAQSPVRPRTSSPRRFRPNSPAGVGFENSYATITEGRGSPRTRSHDRNEGPIRELSRGVSPERFGIAALCDFVQQLAITQREKDDEPANTAE